MAGVRTRKSKDEEDGLIEQYGGQHISKYGGQDLSSHGGPDLSNYGGRTPNFKSDLKQYGGSPIGSFGSPEDLKKKSKEMPGARQGFRDLFQMARGLKGFINSLRDLRRPGGVQEGPPRGPQPIKADIDESMYDTTGFDPTGLGGVAKGSSPYPQKPIKSITRNPKLQQKQDGSLRQVVPDTPQAPPPVTPPPVQKPLDPAAQESFNNKLAYQEKYNADPANDDKTKLGYQPVPGPAGMSILRKGVGQGAEDADPTPLADRAPFESIRGTAGTYSNQAAPLTEYATKAEAENQERADITNLRETQERKLASEASIQEMKNKGLFDVSKERSRGDLAVQKEYNKRPKTSATEAAKYDPTKSLERFKKFGEDDDVTLQAAMIAQAEADGKLDLARTWMLNATADQQKRIRERLNDLYPRGEGEPRW